MFIRGRGIAGLFVLVALVGAACSDGDSDSSGDGSDGDSVSSSGELVTVASTRPEMVTGGDALIEVAAESVDSVTVDGEDAEVDFHSNDGVSRGLVTGLPEGPSTIAVEADGDSGEVEVTNHPIQGPVFSGQQLSIVTCTTDRYGLSESTAPNCEAGPTTRYAYVDAEEGLTYVDDPSEVPDTAETVEIDGEERPAILREETGVINRGVYTITTLANGSSEDPNAADAWDSDHWNGRLVYRFGGGCGTTYSQGFNFFGAPSLELLSEGYAFATNTLNTFQVQCQDIVSAEAAMMTKEYFSETYGVPEVTIGEGGSGGAIQQFLIAQNYPGILDAIAPSLPFPDAVSISPGVVDCALLGNYYATESGSALSAEQRQAINGHISGLTCTFWEETFVPVIDPTRCGFGYRAGGFVTSLPGLAEGLPTVPPEQTYDAETNPEGLRCTFQDSYPQVFAIDEATGFRQRPTDNVGLQYGLEALNDGTISAEEFVVLNEQIGGFDLDANPIAERMAATNDAMEALYSSGRITTGDGPLADIPILSTNIYTDPEGDIHDRIRMFSMNERLADDAGNQAPNYVMWTRPPAPEGELTDRLAGALDAGADVTRLLDEWATALAEDDSDASMAEKLEATRPERAVNSCFDIDGELVDSGAGIYDEAGPCRDDYPVGGTPRTVAGAPLANDIGKCATIAVADAVADGTYEVDLSGDQVARLEAVFPDGVCDWSQPGVGQVPLGEPWQTFG
ncbi:MAG: DUF6351 family protein [Microthrixaceae bacterium]